MTANTTTATFLFQSAVDNAFYNYGNVGMANADFFAVNTIALGTTTLSNSAVAANQVSSNQVSSPVVVLTPLTFATLPSSKANGMLATITDANVATWGANVTIGGGTINALIRWNGAATVNNWTIVGI